MPTTLTRIPARLRYLLALAGATLAMVAVVPATASADTTCQFQDDIFYCEVDNGDGSFTYVDSNGKIINYPDVISADEEHAGS